MRGMLAKTLEKKLIDNIYNNNIDMVTEQQQQ